jgi:hypothetical protein
MLDELKAEILRELGDAAEAGRLTTKNSRVLAVLAHIQRHEGLDAGRRIVSWASVSRSGYWRGVSGVRGRWLRRELIAALRWRLRENSHDGFRDSYRDHPLSVVLEDQPKELGCQLAMDSPQLTINIISDKKERHSLLQGLHAGLNQARVIVSPRPDTLTRFDTGHMRKRSFVAGRNSSTPALPPSQVSISWSPRKAGIRS